MYHCIHNYIQTGTGFGGGLLKLRGRLDRPARVQQGPAEVVPRDEARRVLVCAMAPASSARAAVWVVAVRARMGGKTRVHWRPRGRAVHGGARAQKSEWGRVSHAMQVCVMIGG